MVVREAAILKVLRDSPPFRPQAARWGFFVARVDWP